MSNWNTDGCTSEECTKSLSASSSLSQGKTFLDMNQAYHGGKRTRKNRKQRGGMSAYPGDFSVELPADLHVSAGVAGQDQSFADLSQFVGKYGMSGGKRRKNRKSTRKNSKNRKNGGSYQPGNANAPNYMILSPQEESAAMLNPQWYTENLVVPSYVAPVTGYASQAVSQYVNQADYKQQAGRRSRRRHRH